MPLCFKAFLFVVLDEKSSEKPVPNATLQVTGAVGWRREGLLYKKNEVLFTLEVLWSQISYYISQFLLILRILSRFSWILLKV